METVFSMIAVVIGICCVVWLAVVILRFVDRLTFGKPLTSEECERVQREFEARLTCPQWDQLTGHFGCEIPRPLRDFYADIDCLRRELFYVIPADADDESEHHFVARFEPADLITVSQACLPSGRKSFPFASDDFGNWYFVDLADDGLCVNYFDHDGGCVCPVADQLDTFLNWKTYSGKDARHPI